MRLSQFYLEVWLPMTVAVSDMEWRGVRIDPLVASRAAEQLVPELEWTELELNTWAGYKLNWNSPKQVAAFLYDFRGWRVPPICGAPQAIKIVREGERPADAMAIEYTADHARDLEDRKFLRKLLGYRKQSTVRGFLNRFPTFLDSAGRVHTIFSASTETGRLSSKKPAMQNLPVACRDALIPADGKLFVCLDYSGLEWRILAHELNARYGDSSLLDEILNGVDPHWATACRMGEEGVPFFSKAQGEYDATRHKKLRDPAKNLNYGINYGKTAVGLGAQSRDENGDPMGRKFGQMLLDSFFKARPGVARFQEDMVQLAKLNGHVRSLLGRPRKVEIDGGGKREERKAKNVIQNSAADVMAMATVRCAESKELAELGAEMVLNIHDELLFEVPEKNAKRAYEVAAHCMTTCLDRVTDFTCPLAVEGGIGTNWLEAGGK